MFKCTYNAFVCVSECKKARLWMWIRATHNCAVGFLVVDWIQDSLNYRLLDTCCVYAIALVHNERCDDLSHFCWSYLCVRVWLCLYWIARTHLMCYDLSCCVYVEILNEKKNVCAMLCRCAFIWCCRRRCQCRLSVWSLILTDTTAWIACWCVCFLSQQDGTFLCGFLILFLSLRINKLKPFLQIQNDTTSDEWICEQQINQHVV